VVLGFRSRAALELENLALRHQVGVLKRSARKRPKLTPADRLLWVWLSRIWRDWRSALAIVKPGKVVAWHRAGFRLFWTSFCNIRMTGGNAVATGVEDERLTFLVFILFDFTDENDMVAAVVLTNFPADELGDDAVKKRHPSSPFREFDSSKLVGQRSGELPRKMVLARFQNIDCKVSGTTEINKAGCLPR
jgi:hypothetical protein